MSEKIVAKKGEVRYIKTLINLSHAISIVFKKQRNKPGRLLFSTRQSCQVRTPDTTVICGVPLIKGMFPREREQPLR